MQQTDPRRSAQLAEFDAAIARAVRRVRWRRLVLWFRAALRLDTSEAREWLSLEDGHLAALREERRFLAHADERQRERT